MSVGLSLVGVKTISELESIVDIYPECTFEISYYSTPEFIEKALPIISKRVVSVHSLAPKREFFPNLGCKKALEWSKKEILIDAQYASSLGAVNIVLHPGYTIEGLVYTDTAKRMQQVESCGLEEYALSGFPKFCNADYLECKRYKESFETMVESAISLSAKLKKMGINLCLENLPPRPGYLFFMPSEMKALARKGIDMCLDIGHMQVCSAIFDFDLTKEICSVIESGGVRTMHVHSNPSRKGLYTDSHEDPDLYNKDLEKIVRCAVQHNVNLISEVGKCPLHSVDVLMSMFSQTKG